MLSHQPLSVTAWIFSKGMLTPIRTHKTQLMTFRNVTFNGEVLVRCAELVEWGDYSRFKSSIIAFIRQMDSNEF